MRSFRDAFSESGHLRDSYVVDGTRSELADRWLWMCSEAIIALGKMPKRWAVSVESEAFDLEIREMLFGRKRNVYRVLFAIENDRVNVLRVRSTLQQRLIDKLNEDG